MEKLKRFVKAVEYLKKKAEKPTNESVSKLLRYKTLSYISDVIGGSKPITDLLLDRMVENSINKEWIETGKGKMLLESDEVPAEQVANSIKITTASGATVAVLVEGQNEITLLNAFLEERDKVIQTLKEEKQARIDELKKDKEELYKLLNSDLHDISKATNLIFAMARTALQYHAHVASGGNYEREQELLDSLSLRIGDNLKVDAKQDNAVSLNMSSK